MARALARAYQIGYDEAKAQHKRGVQIRPMLDGLDVTKRITSDVRKGHVRFLTSAYRAGSYQCKMETGK